MAETSPTRLFLAATNVATSIPHFISCKVRTIDTFCRLGFLASFWEWALVAVIRMETVIDVTLKVTSAVIPRASANEAVPVKPLWTVVARGGTAIRSGVIVTIGTCRGYSDADAHLSLGFGRGRREADSGNGSYH
jgi:hypothetical protein